MSDTHTDGGTPFPELIDRPAVMRIDLDDVRLAALTWGPEDGPLALCLHGFPDTAWTWRHLGPALAAARYRVIAPFTRGYAPSSLATSGEYHVGALMHDALQIARRFGRDDAVLIGHDWGGITANALLAHPESPFRKVVSMSVPPIPAMQPHRGNAATMLRLAPRQIGNSWYVVFHQLPVVPERVIAPHVERLWRRWSPGLDAAADVEQVVAALSAPDHATAAIGYYRQSLRPWKVPARHRELFDRAQEPPQVPFLYLHGVDDGCMSVEFVDFVEDVVPDGTCIERVEGGGHFLQLDRPEIVNDLILDYLAD